MKLELNASYEDARKLGECFVRANCETNSGAKADEKFLLAVDDQGFWVHHFNENDYCEVVDCRVVTLDLTTCQPNIYKLMEHGFRVEVNFKGQEGDIVDFTEIIDFYYKSSIEKFGGYYEFYDVESIKILDLDKISGVKEVEG